MSWWDQFSSVAEPGPADTTARYFMDEEARRRKRAPAQDLMTDPNSPAATVPTANQAAAVMSDPWTRDQGRAPDEVTQVAPEQFMREQYRAFGGDYEAELSSVRKRREALTPDRQPNQDLEALGRVVPVRLTSDPAKIPESQSAHWDPHAGEIVVSRERQFPGARAHEARHALQPTKWVNRNLVFRNDQELARLSEVDRDNTRRNDRYYSDPDEIDVRLPVIRLTANSDDPATALINLGFAAPEGVEAPVRKWGQDIPRMPEDVSLFRDYYNALPDERKRALWEYMTQNMNLLVERKARGRQAAGPERVVG